MSWSVLPLQCPPSASDFADLVSVLRACVEGGASLGYLLGISEAEAAAYWARIVAEAAEGKRLLLVARDDTGRIIGTAQAAWESRPNGRHRAEVQKVLVFPRHRRKGIARALMEEVETRAKARGVRLLFLDTSVGRGGAEALYGALGYTCIGGIPGYALDPDGTPADNAIYYKALGACGSDSSIAAPRSQSHEPLAPRTAR